MCRLLGEKKNRKTMWQLEGHASSGEGIFFEIRFARASLNADDINIIEKEMVYANREVN